MAKAKPNMTYRLMAIPSKRVLIVGGGGGGGVGSITSSGVGGAGGGAEEIVCEQEYIFQSGLASN